MILLNRLRNLIKRAVVTKAGSDTGNLAIQQISYNGRVGDCDIIFPYGMHANLPPGSLITVVTIEANEENRAGIGGVPEQRIKGLPEGEVVFFHPVTKSKFHFKNDGNVDVEANGDLNINVTGDANITATNVIVEASTNVDITAATEVSVTAPVVNVDAANTNLGTGGLIIARHGDIVEASPGVTIGTIVALGANTSI